MTDSKPAPASTRVRITPAGLMFLAITSVGWGFNWPVTKYLISELPPLTLRGASGVLGALLLASLAILRGQSLAVPRAIWPRLVLAAILNVSGWMVLMGLALLWLPASEAALIAYTMPVWASILAWPVLGERPTLLRTLALVMAFAGLATIMGGNGLTAVHALTDSQPLGSRPSCRAAFAATVRVPSCARSARFAALRSRRDSAARHRRSRATSTSTAATARSRGFAA